MQRRQALLPLLFLAACGESSTPSQDAAPLPPRVGVVHAERRPTPVAFEYGGRVTAVRQTEVRARVGGILLERTGDAVVIGMGINLVSAPELPDRSTTALVDHGAEVSPARMQGLLADAMAHWVTIWREAGLSAVIERWEARAHPRGTPLIARLPDGQVLTGAFEGLASDGALRLGLADGASHVIHAGDIFLV